MRDDLAPLDILFVGVLPPHPGGAAISTGQLVAGFANRGHRVRAVAPITEEALSNGDAWAASNPEVSLTRFLVPHFDTPTYLAPPQGYRELERDQINQIVPGLIAHSRPDVLIAGRETFARYLPELARGYSLPCILFVRGNPTGAILNGTYPDDLADHFLSQYRKAHLILTPAMHLTNGLRELGFDSVKTIPNAIDLTRFRPQPKDQCLLRELGVQEEDILVMLVANLHQGKRPFDLVNSAEIALKHDRRLLYVLVGDGQLREVAEQACRQNGIMERFRFTGWVDYHQMPRYINLADMVVAPSEFEGLARVYLETQACARLLLTSDIPAAREVVQDGETGLLFKKGDVQDLAATTLRAAREPRLRAEIGRAAHQRVQLRSIERAVADYLIAIRGVVEQA